MLAAQKLQPRD